MARVREEVGWWGVLAGWPPDTGGADPARAVDCTATVAATLASFMTMFLMLALTAPLWIVWIPPRVDAAAHMVASTTLTGGAG